ncbi:MAG TPA: MlaD family protein [Solirubrobacterales bacterium]|nr:MlaD family protein [Solirubrobacterales bacterium]
MRRALRAHLRDVVAVIALLAAALFATTVILINQRTTLPAWVPLIGTDRFELEAEFSTAQAVTPGQGQSVDIAGIKVGEVTGVKLEGGHAVVSMEVDNEYAPLIHDDSSLLLRPKTGLNDMVIEVDAGTQSSPEVEEGSTIPLASTQPQVNPDEFLASLDADTQQFLKLLLANGAEALDPEKGRDVKLSNALRRLDPFARDIARISGALAQRRQNISRSIHNFQLLSTELGDRDQDVVNFVDSSDAALAAFAREEASIRSALQELPSTLKVTRGALEGADDLALQSGPALKKLLPGSRATGAALRALRPLFQQTAGPIQNQIRPFTRQVASPVTHVAQISQGLGVATPGLKTGFTDLNLGLNALAFNPGGSDEGYLFYVPWLNHNLQANYLLQDAYGPIRRGILLISCSTAFTAEGTLLAEPYLRLLYQLTGAARASNIPDCQ